jgi:O-antigen/teichoic acid export membrane protein
MYQTLETVFYDISKHLEVRQKYSELCIVFSSLFSAFGNVVKHSLLCLKYTLLSLITCKYKMDGASLAAICGLVIFVLIFLLCLSRDEIRKKREVTCVNSITRLLNLLGQVAEHLWLQLWEVWRL